MSFTMRQIVSENFTTCQLLTIEKFHEKTRFWTKSNLQKTTLGSFWSVKTTSSFIFLHFINGNFLRQKVSEKWIKLWVKLLKMCSIVTLENFKVRLFLNVLPLHIVRFPLKYWIRVQIDKRKCAHRLTNPRQNSSFPVVIKCWPPIFRDENNEQKICTRIGSSHCFTENYQDCNVQRCRFRFIWLNFGVLFSDWAYK